MDILEKKEHYIMLFDYYGCLLTEKQQEYFKAYYFDDLSLKEISEDKNVSRNAVFDQLSKVYKALDEYEQKLKLKKNSDSLNDILKKYSLLKDDNIEKMIKEINSIE